jgi:hypothetical protein
MMTGLWFLLVLFSWGLAMPGIQQVFPQILGDTDEQSKLPKPLTTISTGSLEESKRAFTTHILLVGRPVLEYRAKMVTPLPAPSPYPGSPSSSHSLEGFIV